MEEEKKQKNKGNNDLADHKISENKSSEMNGTSVTGQSNATEPKEVQEAKEKAALIIKQAEDCAREIHGASLEYVDDMLAEVSLAAKRAKESIRIIMEQALEDIDRKIDMIETNQKEILEDLREISENGSRPVRRADYDIKIDESYIPKQAYDIKISDGKEERVESIRPAKQPFEIKIADEWKGRIEHMLDEQNNLHTEEPIKEEPEVDETDDDGFKASDFDLDAEYFNWLSDQDK